MILKVAVLGFQRIIIQYKHDEVHISYSKLIQVQIIVAVHSAATSPYLAL